MPGRRVGRGGTVRKSQNGADGSSQKGDVEEGKQNVVNEISDSDKESVENQASTVDEGSVGWQSAGKKVRNPRKLSLSVEEGTLSVGKKSPKRSHPFNVRHAVNGITQSVRGYVKVHLTQSLSMTFLGSARDA